MKLLAAKTRGIGRLHEASTKLDAVLFAGTAGAAIASRHNVA